MNKIKQFQVEVAAEKGRMLFSISLKFKINY